VSVSSRRLLLALRLLSALLIVLHLAAPWLPEDKAWGLWPTTYLPPVWRNTLAALVLLLLIIPLSTWDALLKRVGLTRRLIHVPRPLAYCLIALAFLPLFWIARLVHTRWGDAYLLVHAIPHPEAKLTYSWQAPLDVFLHAKVWALGNRWFGWSDAMPAYWILSCAAGAIFIFVLCWLSDTMGRNGTEKSLIFGLVATLGTVQLFFGYAENYSLMTVGLLAYLFLAIRVLQQKTDLWWPATVLAITHALHPSTLVLQPSLWYLGWASQRTASNSGTELHSSTRESLATAAKVLLPSVLVGLAVIGFMEAGDHGLSALLGADAPGGGDRSWFVPLLRTTTRWQHYTMFSWQHLLDIVNEQLLTAPLILPSLLLVVFLVRSRIPQESRVVGFLCVAAASYLLLTIVWNPDYGGRRDWDLFAPASIPLTLLLAYLLPRAIPERPALHSASLVLVATQLFHTSAWIFQNTQPWFWPK